MSFVLGTAEFWNAVAFLICALISIKFVYPSIAKGISTYRSGVLQSFQDIETQLSYAKKKLKLAKSQADTLPETVAELSKESQARVRRYRREWEKQRTHIQSYYYDLRQHRRQSIDVRLKREVVCKVGDACADALTALAQQHMNVKANDQLVEQVIDQLSKVK